MTAGTSLFQLGDFTLSSGARSSFKIDCDALTDADWECLAYLLSLKVPAFGSVEGVPSGGLKLAKKMQKYKTVGPLLAVDDVLTTGMSILKYSQDQPNAIGAVIFARSRCPLGVTALFQMNAS